MSISLLKHTIPKYRELNRAHFLKFYKYTYRVFSTSFNFNTQGSFSKVWKMEPINVTINSIG